MATPINKILSNQTQAFSQEELANISASLQEILGQGGGGTQSDYVFIPVFNEQTGDITFMLSTTGASGRGPWHISGAQGPAGVDGQDGTDGKDGKDGYSVSLQSVTDEDGGKKVTLAWGETHETSSFVIPSGAKGADGQNGENGENGTSVIVKSIREFNDIVGTHTKGGTEVTLEWTENNTVKTSAFSAFNGEKGQDGTGTSLTASSGININNNLINVELGDNLKFDNYSNVTTEDNISVSSVRAGYYDNTYTIVNKNGVESRFISSPNVDIMTLSTHGLNNTSSGGNRIITADYDLNHLFFKSYDNNGTYSGDYSQVEVKVLQETAPAETQHRSSIALTDYYGGVEHTGLITVEKIAQWDQGGSFTGVTTAGSVSGDGLTNPLGLKTSAEQALAAVGGKLSPPSATNNDKYWFWNSHIEDFGWTDAGDIINQLSNNIFWSNYEEYAPIATNGLSGAWVEDGEEEFLTFGVDTTNMAANKQYAFTTTGWTEVDVPSTSGYLPTSGGTVSGQLEVHGGSNFDQQFIKLSREGNSCGARIGLGSDTTNGTLALKTFNTQGQNTVQVNIKYNSNNNELIQVQKEGNTVGTLIPAVIHQGSYTPTSDDGILHIVLES